MDDDLLQQPLVLCIFGITGDLAQRKLLPALYQLAKARELPKQTKIIGISRRDVSKTDVFAELEQFVGSSDFDSSVKDYLLAQTDMRQMDLENEDAYRELLSYLQNLESQLGGSVNRLYYLSIPAQSFAPIVRLLGQTGHNEPTNGSENLPRLLIEKPFGFDLASAQALIDAVQEHFSEAQAYRIDHYLAKETAQNILTFRFQNPLFDAVWNNQHIEQISIVAREQLDIEGRANFYEQTGALRDLIQSHLLQLLAITTMARPETMDSAAIHAEKLALLQAIKPAEVGAAIRGQYEGYKQEVENPNSHVETYARLHLEIANETWAGVPVILETGKALDAKLTEGTVCFKQSENGEARNKLLFRLQPSEGITLQLQAKRPGIDSQTQLVDMAFDYTESFHERQPEAYERVIVDAIRGDQTLFASSEEVLASWRIVENLLEAWSQNGDGLQYYAKGSRGPTEL